MDFQNYSHLYETVGHKMKSNFEQQQIPQKSHLVWTNLGKNLCDIKPPLTQSNKAIFKTVVKISGQNKSLDFQNCLHLNEIIGHEMKTNFEQQIPQKSHLVDLWTRESKIVISMPNMKQLKNGGWKWTKRPASLFYFARHELGD